MTPISALEAFVTALVFALAFGAIVTGVLVGLGFALIWILGQFDRRRD